MKNDENHLPGVALPKLEEIIGAYYRANRDVVHDLSSTELNALSKNLLGVPAIAGSVIFLQQAGILSPNKGRKHHLTELGGKLGEAINNLSKAQISQYWAIAAKKSDFMQYVYGFISSTENMVDPEELKREIAYKAGKKPKANVLVGAKTIIDILEKGNLIKRIETKKGTFIQTNVTNSTSLYIGMDKINSLKAIKNSVFDLSKLIDLCNEINYCYENRCFYAVGILVRVILDHIPPIFDLGDFSKVANNYSGSKSFKENMLILDNQSRNIADAYLHTHISGKENKSTPTQVHFSPSLDILLAEIINKLSSEN